jgi:hypothetical protein
MWHRLGISLLPATAVGLRCSCAAVTPAYDDDHAMVCTAVQGKATMCHDILSRILCRVVHVLEWPPRWNRRCDGCPALILEPLLPERASRGWEHRETCWWRWSRAGPCWIYPSRTPPVWHFERPLLPRTELQQSDEMLRSVAPSTGWLRMGTLWCPSWWRPMAALKSRWLCFWVCWVPRWWQQATGANPALLLQLYGSSD